MQKLKNIVMSLPMKVKLILLCSTLVAFSTFLSVSVVYVYTSRVIRSDTERYADEVMAQSKNYLNEKLRGILAKTNYLQLNPDFIRIMKSILHQEKDSYVDETGRITDIISQLKSGEELIDSIYVYAGGYSFYNFDSGMAKTKDFLDTELYRRIPDKSIIYWGTSSENELLNSRQDIIPIVLPVTIYNEHVKNAYIVLNLNSSVLMEQLQTIGTNIGGMVYIQNEEGELVICTHKEDGKLRSILSEEDRNISPDYQISRSILKLNQWEIGCIQSNEVLLNRVKTLRYFMIGIAVVCIVLFTIVANMLADSVTRPLKKLKGLMQQAVKTEFTQEFHVRYDDEVGQLAMGFNELCARIRLLMARVEKEQEQKRKAELQALNAQINPHFLYNTLDCIYWTSMKDGNQDVADVALNISNVFRLGLNKGKETTTIKNELKHAVSYMQVQKIIYKGKYDFQVFCPQELGGHEVIKLILQPLVENSILHGFCNMEHGGEIFIEVSRKDDSILFLVSDNGCGMESELLHNSFEDKGDHGLAVANIRQRLKLHYQDQAGLTYEKMGECGVTAVVRIPYKGEKDVSCFYGG